MGLTFAGTPWSGIIQHMSFTLAHCCRAHSWSSVYQNFDTLGWGLGEDLETASHLVAQDVLDLRTSSSLILPAYLVEVHCSNAEPCWIVGSHYIVYHRSNSSTCNPMKWIVWMVYSQEQPQTSLHRSSHLVYPRVGSWYKKNVRWLPGRPGMRVLFKVNHCVLTWLSLLQCGSLCSSSHSACSRKRLPQSIPQCS